MQTLVLSWINSALNVMSDLSEHFSILVKRSCAPTHLLRVRLERWSILPGIVCLIAPCVSVHAQGSVSPTSLNWVSVPVGGVGGQKVVTLTNEGSPSITISSIALTGTDPTDFKIYSKTCGSTLAAKASCTANIVFAPKTTGKLAATLSFADSASNTPQTMALTGDGTAASGTVSASPTSLAFGSITVGSSSAAKSTTLTNGTSSSVTLSSVAIGGTDAGDFSISSKTCGTSVAASASCSASVIFKPAASGARSATLSFTDSGTGSPQTVALTGTGGSSTSGSASVSPASLNWVSVAVGGVGGQKVVTLANGGASTLNISSIALGGANPTDFKIYSKTCGATLAASASCTVNVAFAPIASGDLSATLVFTDGASNSPQSMTLTGYAPGGTSGSVSASPSSLTFTSSAVGTSSAAQTATLANGTASSVTISSVTIGGADAGDFSIASKTCGTSLGASANCTASIEFKPTATGTRTATLSFTDSATSSPQTVALSGSVVTAGQLTITPTAVSVTAIGTAQFTANTSVKWSTSCGSISTTGLFTAPAATTSCTITATSTTNASNAVSAKANVVVVNYTSRKNGTDGTGVQANEFVLTPANVSGGKFGQLWSVGLDGAVWGQPLFMNGLTIGGKVRNVLYVTTANDSVYALDANTGAELWKRSFLSTGVTAVSAASLKISNSTGILSTPVIDPVKQVIFVVAETSENNATYFPNRLHGLSLVTGAEITADPELITDPDLEPVMKFQRPGLLLANGMIYIAFGSVEDRAPYHGLLFAFDENTLEQKYVWNVTPTGGQGGLWMSGSTPMADSEGNIYLSTGNGTVGSNNFGMSVVKLSPTLQELDYFTPYNYATYNTNDVDVGSGSLILAPDQNGPYPHLIIACGKPTPIYVINRDAFGGRGTTSDNIVQRLDHQLGNYGNVRDDGQPCYNSPAMWQENVYFAPNYDVLKMFVLDPSTGMLSATPVSKGTFTYNWPGADPVVSANGTANGIVWTVDVMTSTLHANDATNVSTSLYTSPSLGAATRWVPPTVANGHVYVTASGKIIAFGLE